MTPDPASTAAPADQPNRDPGPAPTAAPVPEVNPARLQPLHLAAADPGAERWVVRLRRDDGRSDDAELLLGTRLVAVAAAQQRQRLHRRLRDLAQLAPGPLVVPVAVAFGESDTWILGSPGDVVQLRRLLGMATLTPAQALHVVLGVLAGLERLHGAGLAHGAVAAESVWLTPAGQALLDTAGAAALSTVSGVAGRRLDLAAVERLLLSLLGARVRGVGLSHGGRAAATSAELVRVAAHLGETEDAAAAARLLADAAGPLAGQRSQEVAAAGLAALVGRIRPLSEAGGGTPAGSTGGDEVELLGERSPVATRETTAAPSRFPGTDDAPRPGGEATGVEATPTVVPAGEATPPFSAGWVTTTPPWWARRRLRRAPRRVTVALFGLALLTAVAVGAVVLRGHLHRAAAPSVTHAAPTPAPTPTPSPTPAVPTLVPLTAPAPPQAGEVTAVSVSTTGTPCSAAVIRCTVVVRVDLAPHGRELVAWHFIVVDRCTGARTAEPGSRVDALPTYVYVYDDDTLTLPSGHPTAVYAVTSTPAVAASSPLLIGGDTCPAAP